MSDETTSRGDQPAPSGPRPMGDRPRYGGYRTGGSRDGGARGGDDRSRYGGPRRPRRKVCSFCVDKVKKIDFKDVGRIRRYISDRGKIDPRRKSGTCAKHQRMLTTALKRARLMALLPYTAEQVRAMMSPQARAMAGGPPPPKPDRPPFRPGGPPFAPRPPMGAPAPPTGTTAPVAVASVAATAPAAPATPPAAPAAAATPPGAAREGAAREATPRGDASQPSGGASPPPPPGAARESAERRRE